MMTGKYDESTSDHLRDVHAHHGIGIDQLLELGEHRMQRDLCAFGFHPLAVTSKPSLQALVIPRQPARPAPHIPVIGRSRHKHQT